ncbi:MULTISPECIES: hypothetical protein [Halocynthiibacter]|uniref:Uncharacterized protein n=1 Tax=Halocynthiibacter halioticoli TaxID=2986804 RepID=A0AAE3IYM1_9RHOB|nr:MULTISPECIES: hypothetical protein [Halocynthiibacter]MCV6824149.1 hypothetical protein [Halocynthiibacter halioticoli]MCW4057150.1 hypothetical protein [Halocynthiibacter sp. SDUM655004]
MTTRLVLIICGVILLVFAADHFFLHLDFPVRAARRLGQAIEYIAFWR